MKHNRLIILSLMLVVVITLTGCFGSEGIEAYNNGAEALKKEDYEGACKYFSQAISYDDSEPDYYISYGLSLIHLSRYGEAISSFKKAVADDTEENKENNKRAYRGMGIAYYHKKDYDNAETNLKKALEYNVLTDYDFECYLYLGAINKSQGETEEAYNNYVKACEINSQSLEAMVGKYEEEVELGKVDEAAQTLGSALALSPATEEENYLYGKMQYYNSDYDSAYGTLTQAVTNGFDDARLMLGTMAVVQGQYENAITYFNDYVSVTGDSNNLTVCTQMTNCYVALKKYKKALNWINQACELDVLDSQLTELRYQQITLNEKLGKNKVALDLAKEYTATYPDDRRFLKEYNYIKNHFFPDGTNTDGTNTDGTTTGV